ncbi:MAG: patatin-like phospholipase family protein [Legionellaceae bacterium]|nr:patatin-like phospholipase family protein [Legionellaceae bacterium]
MGAIKKITFSGGGAKGVAYAGAISALSETKQLEGVTEVSGASAGAITAAFVACSMDAETFRETLFTTNLKELKGKKVQEWSSGVIPGITRDAEPIYQLLKQHIHQSILLYFKNRYPEAFDPASGELFIDKLPQALQENEAVIAIIKKSMSSDEMSQVTFGDLSVLNQLDPKVFKNLSINATEHPSGDAFIFNAQTAKDVPIAVASRASAAIPIAFSPMTIKINGQERVFIDGGYQDNLPTNDTNEQEVNERLVFAFSEGLDLAKNPVYKALNTKNVIVKNIIAHAEHALVNSPSSFKIASLLNEQPISLSNKWKLFFILREQYITNKNSDSKDRTKLLEQKVEDVLTNQLYNPSIKDKLLRNWAVKAFGGLMAGYTNTAKKEEGFQVLRTTYSKQTVALSVGKVTTQDFADGKKYARIIAASAYFETINHLAQREDAVEDKAQQFNRQLVANFLTLKAAFQTSDNPEINHFNQKFQNEHDRLVRLGLDETSDEYQYKMSSFIKYYANHHMGSMSAFLFSRAVEFTNKTISQEALEKEMYVEMFRRDPVFSRAKLDGKMFYEADQIEAHLKNHSL